MTYDRLNGSQLFQDVLLHVFGLSQETVSTIAQNLEQTSEIELVNQRILTLPTEVLEALSTATQYGSSDDNIHDIELGDPETQQMGSFYKDNVDGVPDPEEHEECCDANYDDIKNILSRLNINSNTTGSLREFMTRTLVELNQVDTETVLDADSDNAIDPATKKRIDSLRASGNDTQANLLRKNAMRKSIMKRKSGPRTPMDNMIDAKKRDLAIAIKKRDDALNQTGGV